MVRKRFDIEMSGMYTGEFMTDDELEIIDSDMFKDIIGDEFVTDFDPDSFDFDDEYDYGVSMNGL